MAAYLFVAAAVIWLIFAVAIPLILINTASIALITGLSRSKWKTFFFSLSAFGAVLMVADYNLGWFTTALVSNISFLEQFIPFLFYLNVSAGLIAAYFLIRNYLDSTNPPEEEQGEFSKRNMIAMGSLVFVGALIIGLQKYYGVANYNSKQFQASLPAGDLDHNVLNNEESNIVLLPINNLFKAWSELDFNLYKEQWDTNATQHSKKFKTRNFSDIINSRHKLFNRLNAVNVLNYKIVSLEKNATGMASVVVN